MSNRLSHYLKFEISDLRTQMAWRRLTPLALVAVHFLRCWWGMSQIGDIWCVLALLRNRYVHFFAQTK